MAPSPSASVLSGVPGLASADAAIHAEGLVKVYRNRWKRTSFQAVDNVSLTVPKGTTFGLLGPNGAGKTTFIKMLLSAVQPTAGRVSVFGRDSREPGARKPIGYLPENHRFPTYLTGRSMLDFYSGLSGMTPTERRQRANELLAAVGLERWADVRLGKYSKGMLQRVGLAQALMHKPRLLVLDEPSDGVDPVGRIHIRDILRELEQQGVTIFLNSHLLAEVELFCQEVAILQRGRVALQGSVRQLTAGKGYRLAVADAPEAVETLLRSRAMAQEPLSTGISFQFADRETANWAVDVLREARCEIESLVPTTSTLEDVFVRTVQAKEAA